jgi:hypothetical protein
MAKETTQSLMTAGSSPDAPDISRLCMAALAPHDSLGKPTLGLPLPIALVVFDEVALAHGAEHAKHYEHL